MIEVVLWYCGYKFYLFLMSVMLINYEDGIILVGMGSDVCIFKEIMEEIIKYYFYMCKNIVFKFKIVCIMN